MPGKEVEIIRWKLKKIILCYADDAILRKGSQDDLKRLVHIFNIVLKKLNGVILDHKTKALVINKEPTRYKIEIDGISIEQIMEINYISYGEKNKYRKRLTQQNT